MVDLTGTRNVTAVVAVSKSRTTVWFRLRLVRVPLKPLKCGGTGTT